LQFLGTAGSTFRPKSHRRCLPFPAIVRAFCDKLNVIGVRAEFVSLPEIGIRGNSHFPISDLDNDKGAGPTFAFFDRQGC